MSQDADAWLAIHCGLMKYVALLGLLCGACGDGRIEKFYDVVGPPRAIATMGFMPSGAPTVLGGFETFGPKDLYRAAGGTWEPALMGTHAGSATMFGRGAALYVGAMSELWRLDDEATFTWTRLEVPSGGRPLGVDGAGRFYGVTDFGLASWDEGSTVWNQLPPDGDSTGGDGPVVDRDGNVYAYSLPVGISRFNARVRRRSTR